MRVGDIRQDAPGDGRPAVEDRTARRSGADAAVHADAADLRAGLRRREPDPAEEPDRPRFERPQSGRDRVRSCRGEAGPERRVPGAEPRPAGRPGSARSPRTGSRGCGTPGPTTRRGRRTAARSTRDDLDDRFFLCSPEDQRPAEFLRGGEPVELTNLTPTGRLAFALPRVAFGFETVFRGGDRVRHRGRLAHRHPGAGRAASDPGVADRTAVPRPGAEAPADDRPAEAGAQRALGAVPARAERTSIAR